MSAEKENRLPVEELRVGIYIYLDVGWMHHPFSFNSFKIKDEEQLRTIRQLGLKTVRWDPARSDIKPPPVPAAPPADETPPPAPAAESLSPAMQAKRDNIQRLHEYREKLAAVEQAFASATTVIRGISKTIHSQPDKTVGEATRLIAQIVDSLLAAPELAIQAMAERPGSEEVYFHSLNVSILAMTLGRELGLPAELVHTLGMGGVFHDIGLLEIPAKILNNPAPLSKAEREFREQHCQYGAEIAKKAKLPVAVGRIILQHHELYDGTGYPQRLKGEAIDPLARIVGIVNAYDNLCNPVNIAHAMTPHEALSHLYARLRAGFDPRFLQAFIRFMGVYPPGSIVGLSNDTIGLVIRVNTKLPLRPSLIVYDPGIPKSEALILDLDKETDINISRAIRPAQLPPAVFDYLSPRRRISYYFDPHATATQPPSP